MTIPIVPGSQQPGSVSLLQAFAPTLAGVALFSGVINLLALTGSLYMLQVYDRVLPSTSVPTLIGLSILLTGLYLVSGVLEFVRARIMARLGTRIDTELTPKVFEAIRLMPLKSAAGGDGMLPLRDLDTVRGFTSGLGLVALFDLPWIPVFLIFVYLLHPLLALLAVAAAALLIVLTLLTEYRSAAPLKAAAMSGAARMQLAETTRRNADAVQAMGISGDLSQRYQAINAKFLGDQLKASDAGGGFGTVTKTIRMLIQSMVLGLGAYLVIQGELSAGAIIAASISVARALAPIEAAIGHWKSFISARQSAARLKTLLRVIDEHTGHKMPLPEPQASMQVEQLFVAPPGQREAIVKNVSFTLLAGDALGVIGPSGSGKSTLGRALVGVWSSSNPGGSVRLDGASLDQWTSVSLGRHIGYMPQDIELFPGTIAENIARFDRKANADDVVAAAKIAGTHEMIVRLPDGYQTKVGEGGRALSGGERQRVALARALYRDPFLVVLDEPNSNLDSSGDTALADAISAVGKRNGIAIVIAHRPAALASVNKVLVLNGGTMKGFGPKDEVLRSVLESVPQARKPAASPDVKVVASEARAETAGTS